MPCFCFCLQQSSAFGIRCGKKALAAAPIVQMRENAQHAAVVESGEKRKLQKIAKTCKKLKKIVLDILSILML